MPFELTINRVGIFAGNLPSIKIDDEEKLVKTFLEQLSIVKESEEFASAKNFICENAEQYQSVEIDALSDVEEMHMRVRRISAPGSERDGTLVGILPSEKFRFAAQAIQSKTSISWIVQARASITSCALQSGERDAKVWWTFEGVPTEDTGSQPSEDDIAAFVTATDDMAEGALDFLHRAYRIAAKETVAPNIKQNELEKRKIYLRVRMSDSSDLPVRALLNALYYSRLDVDQIIKGEAFESAREGLEIFRRFVSSVNHADVNIGDNSLKVENASDGLQAILYRPVVRENERIVAGLGQKAGSILRAEDITKFHGFRARKSEGYLRAMSASRPVSAIVADSEAAFLELVK